jgi:hypothetical protein
MVSYLLIYFIIFIRTRLMDVTNDASARLSYRQRSRNSFKVTNDVIVSPTDLMIVAGETSKERGRRVVAICRGQWPELMRGHAVLLHEVLTRVHRTSHFSTARVGSHAGQVASARVQHGAHPAQSNRAQERSTRSQDNFGLLTGDSETIN